ncbi:MAG: flagellar biosynthesis protein FlhA [Lentisphaerota bacterium]
MKPIGQDSAKPTEDTKPKFRQIDLIMAACLMLVLAVLLIPVPTPFLDVLLVISIGSGVLVLVFVIELKDPLEFSSFPSVLLMLTLFRLSLNVATTRQILLTAYGGEVIQSFGDFVVGGNYVVGIVVFCILMVINFMVITKGSGRIAEVAARFTLDAMPGKQMSIDADLNQGLIDESEALLRRKKLTQEADFYGAMDGASKFVRGDAVAGLIITIINISAGFAIGMLQRGMTASESLARYTILTVGDGLVAAIPSLIISTAAGILVTRAASDEDLGTEVAGQLFVRPKQLLITGGILSIIALVPGLPFLPFIVLGSSLSGLGWSLHRKKILPAGAREGAKGELTSPAGGESKKLGDKKKQPEALPSSASALKNVLAVSPMDLEIGFGLVPLVDRNQGGKLIDRIGMVRNQIAEELGIVLPPVNVRDNVNLKNTEYCVKIRGLEVARGAVRPGSLLAIDPSSEVKLEGYLPVREPAFGFQAYWIPEAKRDLVESKGLTVVDCSSVITTHLAAVVKRFAADILTRQDVNDLIEQLKQTHAAVVQELVPGKMSIGSIHRILQGLLREKVSIRDLAIIMETLADHGGRTQEIALLVEFCRRALGGHICREYQMPDGVLKAIGLHPDLEGLIRKSTHKENVVIGTLTLSPNLAHDILESIRVSMELARRKGAEPVLLCSPSIRPQVRQLTQHDFRDTAVISFAEVPDTVQVDMLSMIPLPKNVEAEAVLEA